MTHRAAAARIRATNAIDAYAVDVVKGRVPAGKYHRLACERHLRDRAHEGTTAFPYRFDLARAERYFRFASKLKHYKGEWAGQFIQLEPHQQFRRGSLFGWLHVGTGLRRYRTSYEEVPRKNGKTLDLAVTAVYTTFFDGEPGAEGYCLATMRSQAMIAFGDAKKLVRSSGLRSRIAIHVKNLHCDATASKLEPLGKDPMDGLNPHWIGGDELHKWKTRERLDVMETATGARRQPLTNYITTAGDDPVSPCGDLHDYAVKILEQVVEDETFFAFIAHADPEDDWLDEATWRKANPNYGVSVKPDDLRMKATKAQHMPAAAAAFKRDHLNIWVNTDAAWLSIEGWRKGQTRWSAEDLRGERCYCAIDLASKIDLAAAAFLFPPTATRRAWRYLVRHFTPADTLLERSRRDRAPYQLWTQRLIPGTAWPSLTTTPGNRIDQAVIKQAILDAKAFGFVLEQVGFDPWNSSNIEQELEAEGIAVVEIPQTIKHMSAPSKEFEADVLDALVDAGGDPVLLWEASNVVVFRDGPDNIKPVKNKSRGKIDGIVAAIMARKLAGLADEDDNVQDPDLVVA
jgi:phage terminase large subunit-like protein